MIIYFSLNLMRLHQAFWHIGVALNVFKPIFNYIDISSESMLTEIKCAAVLTELTSGVSVKAAFHPRQNNTIDT